MFRINLYKFSLQKFFSLIILQWNCWLKWVLANCNDWMITLFWLLIISIKYWRKIKEARKSLKLKLDYINPFNKIYIVYVTQATIMNLFTSYSFKICSVVWRYSGTYKLALIAKTQNSSRYSSESCLNIFLLHRFDILWQNYNMNI